MNSNSAELSSLQQILEQMNREGDFPFSALMDKDGFQIAYAVDDRKNLEKQVAVIAFAQKTINQMRLEMGMNATKEVTVFDAEGQRLICRLFKVADYEVILACLVPHPNQPYRKIMNTTIKQISAAWKV